MTYDVLSLATLPALALLCAVTSVEDCRYGKIRNKWVFLALGWGLAVYAALSLSRLHDASLTSALVENTLFSGSWPRLLLLTALNAFFALLAGFLLFHFDYWSAGDAKLFFAMTLLLPLQYYFRHFLPVFPGFNLFLNTITVAALYVWGDTAWKLWRLVKATPEKNLLREMAGASAVKLRGSLILLLVAGVFFSGLMCVTFYLNLTQRVSLAVGVVGMLALLFSGRHLNAALEKPAWRSRFLAFSAVFFAALLVSSLRLQFLKMAVFMSITFFFIYLMTGIIPELGAKYEVQSDDMPFALWLSLGLLFTILIKGSFLYLVFM